LQEIPVTKKCGQKLRKSFLSKKLHNLYMHTSVFCYVAEVMSKDSQNICGNSTFLLINEKQTNGSVCFKALISIKVQGTRVV
jgi:hypothetical protein